MPVGGAGVDGKARQDEARAGSPGRLKADHRGPKRAPHLRRNDTGAGVKSGTPPVLGLTGGIASGKSTVSAHLARLGAAVIDADRIGHEIVAPQGEAYAAVVAAFGSDIVAPDGTIDRRALGAKVFSDPNQLARLNGISHPVMARRMAERIFAIRAQAQAGHPPAIVLDAAILFEAGWDRLCDVVWTVEAPEETALARLMARNGFSVSQARSRLQAQWPNAERAARAQRVIVNTGTLDELAAQVDAQWRALLATIPAHMEAQAGSPKKADP
jgi:dephospho-CoA kinase